MLRNPAQDNNLVPVSREVTNAKGAIKFLHLVNA